MVWKVCAIVEQQKQRIHVSITGQVQGVGFRPFTYRLAVELGLSGFVANDSHGVVLELQGDPELLEIFLRRLKGELPPLARITGWRRLPKDLVPQESTFRILATSEGGVAEPTPPKRLRRLDAQVTVDTAVCAAMPGGDGRLRPIRATATRSSIAPTAGRGTPSSGGFPTTAPTRPWPSSPCAHSARGEYADPASRRFHAQPIACPRCGPSVWLVDRRRPPDRLRRPHRRRRRDAPKRANPGHQGPGRLPPGLPGRRRPRRPPPPPAQAARRKTLRDHGRRPGRGGGAGRAGRRRAASF